MESTKKIYIYHYEEKEIRAATHHTHWSDGPVRHLPQQGAARGREPPAGPEAGNAPGLPRHRGGTRARRWPPPHGPRRQHGAGRRECWARASARAPEKPTPPPAAVRLAAHGGGGHPEGAQGARGAPSASAPPVTFPLRLPERPKSQAGLRGPPAALPAISSSVPRPPSPSVALGRCQRRPRLRPGPRPRPPQRTRWVGRLHFWD